MSGYNLPGTGTFMILMAVAGVIGWGLIESLLWMLSFIHVSFG
jgi:hypothetical protein